MEMTVNPPTQPTEQVVEEAYRYLLDGYLSSNHRKKVEIIDKAYRFACHAHAGVKRRSGEPYILHPIAVATIVSREIGLGSTSICAALLHDVVEDTDYTVEDIRAQFGDKIALIVDGLTKISGGIFGDKASAQAENFRKLLLTMSEDIRVILIKMADRLHNMRTLSSMPPAKQFKIAGETLYLYAPLAHRLGLFTIKTELEDLSFKYNHPDAYARISEQIAESEQQRNDLFNRFANPIRLQLTKMGLQYEFKARVKSCYSIWKKMETKHIPFEDVYDLYAARIVFECPDEADEKRICWNIYSVITDLYRLHPDRVRDWVSTPKTNGYRALHITVMGPEGKWIEVQIRSRRMDDIAERGFAAHWKYKIGEGEEDTELTVWLKTVEDILKNPEPDAIDFLDTIKLNLFASEIVVFTPAGEPFNMPQGATVLDLAFTLHTDLGTHCIAGKINHRLVPRTHVLSSGDQVEIITSQAQRPEADWEQYLVTAKGRTRLRTALRHNRRQIIALGDRRLRAFLTEHGITPDNEVLMRIINGVEARNKEDLFYKIGSDEIALSEQLLKKTNRRNGPGLLTKLLRNPFASSRNQAETDNVATAIDTKAVYVLKTDGGNSNYRLADCCHPIPGDDALGFIDDDNHVVVHKMDCPVVQRLKASYGPRLLETRWAGSTTKFLASLRVDGIDRRGILQEIIYIISTNMSIDMRRLNISADGGLFHCELDVLIEDTDVVTNLCKRLKRVRGVNSANRIS